MAERVVVFKISIPDSPGSLAGFLSQGASYGLDLHGLCAVGGAGGSGVAYLCPKDADKARSLAAAGGLQIEECAGFLVQGSDKAGAAGGSLKPLGDAGINGVACAALVMGGEYRLLAVVAKDDADRAETALAG